MLWLYFICGIVTSLITTIFKRRALSLLSRGVHNYLLWRYPIQSLDGHVTIPTAPWSLPNGQGDIAKFLKGKQSSKDWKRRLGSAYRIWSGTRGEIVISALDDIRSVFADSDRHTKAHHNNSGWLFGELLGQCLGELSGSRWLKVHRVVAPSFSYSQIQKYAPRIQHRVQAWVRELQLGQENSITATMAPVKEMRSLLLHVIAEVLYGQIAARSLDELESIARKREGLLFAAFTKSLFRYSWSQFLPMRMIADLRRFQRAWASWNVDAIKQSTDSTPARILLQAAMDGEIVEQEALQTLDEMLFANIDVTLAAAAWCVVSLAEHPWAQDELVCEMRQVKRDGKWASYVGDSSTLLAATVLESSRLRPLAAFSVPQSAPTTREIGGCSYSVPAGTDFIVDTYTVNLSSHVWGDDSHQFRPSRWLNMSSKQRQARRYQCWTFGFGPRQCVGKFLAETILRSIVADLVGAFVMMLSPGCRDSSARDAQCWITTPIAEVIYSSRSEETL